MFAASKDTEIPFIFSEPQFSPGFEGNALSGNGKKCIECRKESRCDCRYCAVPTTTRMPALSWQLLSTAPRTITWPHPWEKPLFLMLLPGSFVEMPGRGLEP